MGSVSGPDPHRGAQAAHQVQNLRPGGALVEGVPYVEEFGTSLGISFGELKLWEARIGYLFLLGKLVSQRGVQQLPHLAASSSRAAAKEARSEFQQPVELLWHHHSREPSFGRYSSTRRAHWETWFA